MRRRAKTSVAPPLQQADFDALPISVQYVVPGKSISGGCDRSAAPPHLDISYLAAAGVGHYANISLATAGGSTFRLWNGCRSDAQRLLGPVHLLPSAPR